MAVPCLILWHFLLQVFFVIRLHPTQIAANLSQIQDPDPFISNDLMDGRDAFLAIAREKHYEFSSLRRAQFSTMALLYELHNQGKDNFVYTCNTCKAHVETRWHCSVCDVSLLSQSLLGHSSRNVCRQLLLCFTNLLDCGIFEMYINVAFVSECCCKWVCMK